MTEATGRLMKNSVSEDLLLIYFIPSPRKPDTEGKIKKGGRPMLLHPLATTHPRISARLLVSSWLYE